MINTGASCNLVRKYLVFNNLTFCSILKHEIKQNNLLLPDVIDADHQNSCLFTNKGHFSSPLWVLISVLAKFHE